jgi:predicted RNA-binding Zn ribbon-like protein
MSEIHDMAPEPPGGPAELFVEFANSEWATGAELGTWLAASRIGPERSARPRLDRELPAFQELQGLVRAIAARTDRGTPPSRAQVAALNRILRDGLHYHALRAGSGSATFSMTPVGDPFDQARAAVAGSLAHFLADHEPGRLRRCASDTCRWLFVDRSPGGRRRWCVMRVCGNRDKVRRHRQRTARRGPTDVRRSRARRASPSTT